MSYLKCYLSDYKFNILHKYNFIPLLSFHEYTEISKMYKPNRRLEMLLDTGTSESLII